MTSGAWVCMAVSFAVRICGIAMSLNKIIRTNK